MDIKMLFVKPNNFDKNAFYILEKIIELSGEQPLMFTDMSKGLLSLILKLQINKIHYKDSGKVLINPSLTIPSKVIRCDMDSLFKEYNKLEEQKGKE